MLPVFYCEPRLYFNHLYGILGVILEARICQCLLRAEVCNIFAIYFKLQYSVSNNCTKIVLCIWHYGRVVKAVDSNTWFLITWPVEISTPLWGRRFESCQCRWSFYLDSSCPRCPYWIARSMTAFREFQTLVTLSGYTLVHVYRCKVVPTSCRFWTWLRRKRLVSGHTSLTESLKQEK